MSEPRERSGLMRMWRRGEVLEQDHVLLNLTRRCNQRCVFCFEEERPWGEPDGEEARRILREARASSDEALFMGGEGLMRPDALELIAYARSVGLRMGAFTNGRVLAREGYLEALAEAGLEGVVISTNYADAEHFARGTRLPAQRFDEFLEALHRVQDFQRTPAARTMPVGFETVYTRFVQGQLLEVVSLLREHVGEGFERYGVKGFQPPTLPYPEPLSPRFREGRDELVQLCEALAGDIEVEFSRIPLCLIPGHEHRSLEVAYLASRTRLYSNFAEKGAVETERDEQAFFAQSPFRWLCAECALRTACPHGFADWNSAMAPPIPDSRPFPSAQPPLADVLRRFSPKDELEEEALTLREQAFSAVALPERTLVELLRGLDVGGPCELTVRGRPILSAVWETGGLDLGFALSKAPQDERDVFIVGALALRFDEGALADPDARLRLLRAVSTSPACEPEHWAGATETYGAPEAAAEAGARLWAVFGERLWPGVGALGAWDTLRARVRDDGGLALTMVDADGRRARAVLYGEGFAAPTGEPAGVRAFTSERLTIDLFLEENPTADVLGAHRAIGVLADALCDLAESAAQPPADVSPEEGPARLRVRFAERGGRAPRSWEFELHAADPVGTAFTQTSGEDDRAATYFRTLLSRSAEAIGAPPQVDNLERWQRQIVGRLSQSPLAHKLTVAFRPEGFPR